MEQTKAQKKLKQYIISYQKNQYFGKGIRGELRKGYSQIQSKIHMFRISSLPLSKSMQNFIDTQKYYSRLTKYVQKVQQQITSSNNIYFPLQYFPKTFKTQLQQFQKNINLAINMFKSFINLYSYFYYMRITHNNLSLTNVGITFDNQIKLMDFMQSSSSNFQQNAENDLIKCKEMAKIIFQNRQKYSHKIEIFFDSLTKWQHIFLQWDASCELASIYIPKKNNTYNMFILLDKLKNTLSQNSQYYYEIKYSIMLLMQSYIVSQTQPKYKVEQKKIAQIIQRPKIDDLDYYNSIIHDLIKDHQYFEWNSVQRLALICSVIPILNHQFIYQSIIKQFKIHAEMEVMECQILGDCLIKFYKETIKSFKINLF